MDARQEHFLSVGPLTEPGSLPLSAKEVDTPLKTALSVCSLLISPVEPSIPALALDGLCVAED